MATNIAERKERKADSAPASGKKNKFPGGRMELIETLSDRERPSSPHSKLEKKLGNELGVPVSVSEHPESDMTQEEVDQLAAELKPLRRKK